MLYLINNLFCSYGWKYYKEKKYYIIKFFIKCKVDMFIMRYIIKVNLWNIIYLGLGGG